MGDVVRLKSKKEILIDCLQELIKNIETGKYNVDKMAVILKDEKEKLTYTIYHECDFFDKQSMLCALQTDIVDILLEENINRYIKKARGDL